MTIKDKVMKVIATLSYEFCGIPFSMYMDDYIRIYDRTDGSCIYDCRLDEFHKMPEHLQNSEYKQEVLIKLPKETLTGRAYFAICFYLDAVKYPEGGISMKHKYV